ncbi:MAG: hypothetical protein VX598_06700 [Verrucomicrobiota bacterium]|nr:hypothetical protein [Verrucomicrobiota bacterium]
MRASRGGGKGDRLAILTPQGRRAEESHPNPLLGQATQKKDGHLGRPRNQHGAWLKIGS